MPEVKTLTVDQSIPRKLYTLEELSYNLWCSWHPEVVSLFRRLDINLWEEVYHNPILFLGRIRQDQLESAAKDDGFITQLNQVYRDFQRYMKNTGMFQHDLDKPLDFTIAYFSAEYGISECLPVYSGGLGILSGDHLKSASDLNLPLIGVGLLYQKGYFHQSLNSEGWQQEILRENDFLNMPIQMEKNENGIPLQISVKLKGRDVGAYIWRVQVDRKSVV